MHLYEEIEAYVTDLIHSGKLREGDQIPKEVDLAAQFHASRPTVRQALARLTMNGVITRTKGRGSFVSRKKITQEYTRFISSYRDELQKKGLTSRTVVTSFEKKKATASISKSSIWQKILPYISCHACAILTVIRIKSRFCSQRSTFPVPFALYWTQHSLKTRLFMIRLNHRDSLSPTCCAKLKFAEHRHILRVCLE